ncbi:MAG: HD domain-containing phosphohydrolase [Pseudomonadota bacterium]
MIYRTSVPFRVLVTVRVMLIILAITAIFLWFVLGRVQMQVERNGRENFHQLARGAFDELDAMTISFMRYLETVAQLLPTVPDIYAESATSALAQSFLQLPGPNALSVSTPGEGMLYFLKEDKEAPAGSVYTMGQMRAKPGEQKIIHVSYYAADGKVLQRRQIVTDLPVLKSEWQQRAMHSDTIVVSPPFDVYGRDYQATSMVLRSQHRLILLTTPLEKSDRLLARIPVSANGAVLMIDEQQRLLAYRMNGPNWNALDTNKSRMDTLAQLGDPVLADIARTLHQLAQNQTSLVTLGGRQFLLAWHDMAKNHGSNYRILLLAPLSDMSQAAAGGRRDAWLVALLSLTIVLPLTWFGASAMARVLQDLIENSERIGHFDFSPSEQPMKSAVREIRELGLAHESMRNALARDTRSLQRSSSHLEHLVQTGIKLVDEKDQSSLLDAILLAARENTGAEIAILFLRDDDDILRPAASSGMAMPQLVPALDMKLSQLQNTSLAVYTARSCTMTVVDDFENDPRPELILIRQHHRNDPSFRALTLVSLPLQTPDNKVTGVMQLFNATDPEFAKVAPFSQSQVAYLKALAAQATVALENQKLITAQNNLLDTLVRTLGEAVDAKSPYTGRHCARVPELALMLAEEAHAAKSGPLAEFSFGSEEEWREFRIGAWLHDCGKIVSPEHVMDKATKLEMVYNRIHEIRTRFEVLLRDARIQILQARLDGVLDDAAADDLFKQRAEEFQQQFEMIARSNIGSEKMSAEDIVRTREIGQQHWLRHFDNRLGLAQEELAQHQQHSDPSLPASETLLADKPWHVIARSEEDKRTLTDGFRMAVPEHLYNHGELYNLCIERGTLTPEERFKINEHIIHTIRMLEGANFPAHLRRVPEYAGTHHEAMNGSGYPRGLTAAELSIPARIMAIADIFEALTAADRPYKEAKPLSESIAILHRMKLKGHIDPDLFDLFLRKGVHLRYAQRFLSPTQIDTPDITPYLG